VFNRTYGCQVPEDRSTVFDGEHTVSGSKSGAGAPPPPANKLVMRMVAMAPDQEARLLAFMRWAGPVMLASLGMNPSEPRQLRRAPGDPHSLSLTHACHATTSRAEW
jgi:hypothetical protein